jgi:hypothetical protein
VALGLLPDKGAELHWFNGSVFIDYYGGKEIKDQFSFNVFIIYIIGRNTDPGIVNHLIYFDFTLK